MRLFILAATMINALPAFAELDANCDQTCTIQIEQLVPLRKALNSLDRPVRLGAIEATTRQALNSSYEDVRLVALELLMPNAKSLSPEVRGKAMNAILKLAAGTNSNEVETLALSLLAYSAHSPLEIFYLKGIESVETLALRSAFTHIKNAAIQELSFCLSYFYSRKAERAIELAIKNISKN